MAIDRLVGADASVEKATFAAPLITGSPVKTPTSFYKIVAKTVGSTVFPGNWAVGDIIPGKAIVGSFSATESAALATFTPVTDASSWKWEFNRDEIEVTVLIDSTKKYRAGKSDASGTLEGINFISELKKVGGIANKFLRVATGDSKLAGAITLSGIDQSDFYFRGYLQDDSTVGETLTYLMGKIELFGWSAGASVGDAQSWSSGMRFVGNDPILYCIDYVAST